MKKPKTMVATPETHEWVGKKCGIRTPYELTTEEEYLEGDETDCLECDSECESPCMAVRVSRIAS